MRGDAVRDEQVRQRLQHLQRPPPPRHDDRQTFPGVFIHDHQDLQDPPVMRPRRQKVIRPHVVAIRRAATDARPIGEPQPAPFGLFLGHFQPFPAPQPLDPLVILTCPQWSYQFL